MRSETQIRTLLERVLSMADAPEAQVAYNAGRQLNTRFGQNAITQNMATHSESLRLYLANGRRHGSSVTNKLDDASLRALVRRARDIVAAAPEDPECMPLPGPQAYPAVPRRFFDAAAAVTPADLARGVRQAVALAAAEGYTAGGLSHLACRTAALANSHGLLVTDTVSDASFSVTVHGPHGSASAARTCNSPAQLDCAQIAETAVTAAAAAQQPRDIEPGDYTVIFEPEAVADFIAFMAWNLQARPAAEGSTAFSGKLGSRMFGDNISLTTEIDVPDLPACAFGEAGLPVHRTAWIESGVVKRLHHDRYWAQQQGTAPDVSLYPLFMAGEDRDVTDLVAQCERGLLVRRLWYIRYVDRKEMLLTGMTRDGVFLVENGSVVCPVINLRFNESPIVFLQNAVALSRPRRVGGVMVPAVLSESFTFSSKTASV